ncbi:MAG: hypothetical protein ACYSU6_03480 [Planctomycetota bacterium]
MADGDGDGNSVVDMGAYEVPVPPVEVAMHFPTSFWRQSCLCLGHGCSV